MSFVNKEQVITQQIHLDKNHKPIREFLRDLGAIREPVELVVQGMVVAKLIAPTELSEKEKRRILAEGWAVVEKVRARHGQGGR